MKSSMLKLYKVYIYTTKPKPYDSFIFLHVTDLYKGGGMLVIKEQDGVEHIYPASIIDKIIIKE